MKHYCQTILDKLQQQSDILRNMPITLKITGSVDNGSVDVLKKNIELNPDYIKNPKVVAPTIAHELAHIVYYELYGFKRNKEDEIFADVYGMILCKRAGFDISEFRNEWNNKLERMTNTNEHPQNKIRYLILKRASAYLDDIDTIKIDHQSAGRPDFEEAPFDITLRREVLKKRYKIEDDDKKNEQNTVDIFREDIPLSELKQKILNTDLLGHQNGDLNRLSAKILQNKILYEDYKVLEKMHNTLSQTAFYNSEEWYDKDRIIPFENKMMNHLKGMKQKQTPQEFRKDVEVLLWHKNRFSSPQQRKQLQSWYVESLLEQYGKDDGTDKYSQQLNENLNKLNNKLHNADILPLLQKIKDALVLKDRNIPILQSFAQQNSQETKQIRMETLVTECLLSFDQAVQTIRFLSNNKIKPFRYECFEGKYWYNDYTRKNEPLMTVSAIKENELNEIRNDMANITPKKRTELFCLLLEGVYGRNGAQTLEMFINKKKTNDKIYKTLVDEYIKTYEPEQQPYVIASLISKKKPNKDYTYEDYFKMILENSGIDGIRAYNALYTDKRKEEIFSLATNRSALHSQDMIIFANLRSLGQKMAQQSDDNLKKIGQKIISATQKSIAKPLRRELDG